MRTNGKTLIMAEKISFPILYASILIMNDRVIATKSWPDAHTLLEFLSAKP